MNPILNPHNAFPLLKSYIFDLKRLQSAPPEQIKKYKDQIFKKMVEYAYSVPVYHSIYKKHGVHPQDIRGIEDITKLPIITKDDIKNNFPDKILPTNYNKKNGHIYCTGGTTGKPLCIYTDFYTIGKGAMTSLRQLKILDVAKKNLKIAHLGNFNPYRIDLIAQEHFQKHVWFMVNKKNTLNIDISTPIKQILEKLAEFKPDVIMSYPAIYQHLAYLKRKGFGKELQPTLLWVGGAMLDAYTKKYVEDVFNCPLLNIYPSVEGGADIAFECFEGTWHVNDDFFHIEAIDEQQNLVDYGKRGHIVLTRLWGRGTPIIRYAGMDDWVRIQPPKTCSCGLTTSVIEGGVEGRKRANIILPNGKVFPPGAFCFITPVLNNLKTFKVKQYQIIQHSIHDIQVLLVIDEDLRHVGPSVEKIKEEIKKMYQMKSGDEVTIRVDEVDEIKNEKNASKPPPIVISHVQQDNGYHMLDE
jgi:phenylacetate-CoA ligase